MSLAALRQENVTGFVLAGGESRRMGRDKALVEFAGRPLIVHAIEILRQGGVEVRIAGTQADLSRYAPVVSDVERGRGPLGGICAALADCETDRAVFLPVDLPLLPSALITFMLLRNQVTGVPVTTVAVSGFPQSFPAIVHRATLSGLEASLKRSHGGCYAGFESAAAELGKPLETIPVEYLTQAGQVRHPAGLSPALWFLNVNSPADLRRGELLFRRRVA